LASEGADKLNISKRSKSACIGHIKRKLLQKQPLTGKSLDLCLNIITPDKENKSVLSDIVRNICDKILNRLNLDDYELYVLCDVILVHAQIYENHSFEYLKEENGAANAI